MEVDQSGCMSIVLLTWFGYLNPVYLFVVGCTSDFIVFYFTFWGLLIHRIETIHCSDQSEFPYN